MAEPQRWTVKIDQLPEEGIEAASPAEALQKVTELIRTRQSLAVLDDDEPVVIKHPDRSVLLRNGTVGGFRRWNGSDIGELERPI